MAVEEFLSKISKYYFFPWYVVEALKAVYMFWTPTTKS